MTDRQLDIIATTPFTFTVPRYVKGRLTAADFMYFKWPKSLDRRRYVIAVETNDTAGPQFRTISGLMGSVELPHVQYPWHGRVGVIPDNPNLPAFEAETSRGGTYIIPEVPQGMNGVFQMERHGGYTSMGI